MIRFEHLSKTFQTKDGAFEALKDVSFEIKEICSLPACFLHTGDQTSRSHFTELDT